MKFFFLSLFLTFSQASEKVFLCPPMFSESQPLKGQYQELKGDFYLQKMDLFKPLHGTPFVAFKILYQNNILMSCYAPYRLENDKDTLVIPRFKINSYLLPIEAKNSDDMKLAYRVPGQFIRDYYIETIKAKLCIETDEKGKEYILTIFPDFFYSLDFLTFKPL
jgi:hypothetical protein